MCSGCVKANFPQVHCDSCGTTQIPILSMKWDLDGEDHTFCSSCWKRDWRPIDQYVADRDYELHDEIRAEEAQPLPDDVLAAIVRGAGALPIKQIRAHPRDRGPWTVACQAPGCVRTALYKSLNCVDHQRETPTP